MIEQRWKLLDRIAKRQVKQFLKALGLDYKSGSRAQLIRNYQNHILSESFEQIMGHEEEWEYEANQVDSSVAGWVREPDEDEWESSESEEDEIRDARLEEQGVATVQSILPPTEPWIISKPKSFPAPFAIHHCCHSTANGRHHATATKHGSEHGIRSMESAVGSQCYIGVFPLLSSVPCYFELHILSIMQPLYSSQPQIRLMEQLGVVEMLEVLQLHGSHRIASIGRAILLAYYPPEPDIGEVVTIIT